MTIQPGDKVFVEDLELTWGTFTGWLTVQDMFESGNHATLMNLGNQGVTLVSGIGIERVQKVDQGTGEVPPERTKAAGA